MNSLKLSARQKNLIKSSWKIVRHEGGMTNQYILYDNLFEISDSQKFFKKRGNDDKVDFTKLGKKFEYTMNFIVDCVTSDAEDSEELNSAIMQVGNIHNRIKVEARYYDYFNQACLGLMKKILGSRMTDEVEAAWTALLEQLAVLFLNAPEVKENKFQQLLKKLFG